MTNRFSQEELEKKLQEAPDHLKEALQSEEFGEEVDGSVSKYSLDEDQINSLVEEVGFVLLGLAPLADMPTNLQASLLIEQSVSEEIAKDLSAVITNKLLSKPSTKTAGNAEEIFFDDGNKTIVTTSFFRYKAQSWPLSSITRVLFFPISLEIPLILSMGVVSLLSIVAILSFSVGWMIGGVIGLLIGGLTLKSIFSRDYVVLVEFISDEDLSIETKDKEYAIKLRDALHRAIGGGL